MNTQVPDLLNEKILQVLPNMASTSGEGSDLRSPFDAFLLHCFPDLLFNAEQPLKSPEPGPETATNHRDRQKNIIETHPQPRAEKNLRLGRVEPLKLTTFTTISTVFPETQRSQSEAKKNEIEASGTQHHQQPGKQNPEKEKKQDHEKQVRVSIFVPNRDRDSRCFASIFEPWAILGPTKSPSLPP